MTTRIEAGVEAPSTCGFVMAVIPRKHQYYVRVAMAKK